MDSTKKDISPLPYPLSRKTRLCIMFTLIGVFCVMTPLLILSAKGFTFDIATRTLVHGGALSIQTNPEEVSLFLNNIPVQSQIPFRIPHLIPGNYEVRIERSGYYPWKLPITILSNQTTYLHDIELFRIQKPVLLLQDEKHIDDFSFSEKNDSLLFTQKRENIFEIISLNPRKFEQNLLTRVISEYHPLVEWSPNEAGVGVQYLFENHASILLFNPDNPLRIQTLTVPEKNMPFVQWGKGDDSDTLFVQNKKNIQKMTVDTTTEFFSLRDASSLWFIDSKEKVWEFFENKFQTFENGNKKNYGETNISFSQILDANDKRIILIADKKIFILSFNEKEIVHTEEIPFSGYVFDTHTKNYLIWYQGELRAIDPHGNVIFINRFSGDIHSIHPMTSAGTQLMVLDNKIIAFDPSFFRTHELAQTEVIEKITVSEKRREIYFLGRVEGKHGLWKLGF